MLIKRDWKYCAVVMLLILVTALNAGFSGQLVLAGQVGGGGGPIPTITLNVPDSGVPGGAVSVTGSIYNNGPAAGVSLGLTVKDANGAVYYTDQTTSDANGSFGFDFTVPATGPAGTWTVDVAGGGTTGHEVFTVVSAPAPVLTRITVSGPTPDLTVGGVVYDLNNLTRAGYDQHNNPYDISGFSVTWQIVAGANFASLSGSILSPVSPGTGTVTATVCGVVSDPISFTVSPSSSSSSNLFVQVTDMHLCNAADAQKYLKSSPNYDPEAYASQFVTEMKSLQPSFVVNTGDLVALADTKKIATGLAWYQLYNKDVAQPLRDAGVPLYNVSGNHDLGGTNYYTGPDDSRIPVDLKVYYGNGLFTQMTGSQRFYSFDQGSYHYIALDPDEIPNAKTGVGFVQLSQEQMAWLRIDLQTNKDKNIILFFHQPSSDWTNWSDVAKILSGYKIKMIFDGHWHLNTRVDNGFPEQSSSALCGSWWRDSVGKDGSPYGYRLVCPTSDGVSSFYKELGSNQQINFITPEDIVISGQAPLYAQAFDSNQAITGMQYRIDGGAWQAMSMKQVSVWDEGRATMSIAPDGQYHQVEVSYVGADNKRFSSSKLFKFDSNQVVDIKTIEDHFNDFRGRYATVAATVTAALDVGNEPVLQDQSAGMTAWAGECIGCPQFVVGTGLKLRGQISTDGYSMQQLQVHSAADVASADIPTIKSPKVLTIPDVPAAYYQWVKIQGVTVTEIDDSSDFYVQDQAGHKLPIYTGDQIPVYNAQTALHLGETLDISGIAYNYNGAPEICTRLLDDLVPQSPALTAPVKIAVFSDPHYYAPELGTTGSAFQQYLNSDRKMLAESKAILTSAITAIKNSDAQIVLVTGDLTKDGELLDHQQFVGYLKQLKDAGKKVYVIDGNHDIDNPDAFSYSGDTKTPVSHITSADFKNIYHDYGYGDAVATDVYSLSYAVDPAPGLRIIAMDSALYDTNIADNAPKTADAFSADRLNWINAEIADGIAKGKTVIGMMHHGVTNHFSLESQFFPDFVIQNADQVATDLASHGMRVIFTGHFHANDITKVPNQPLFDVETGSLVTYPVPYRFIELTPDNRLKITTDRVANIDYDTKGQAFHDYARSYLAQGISGLVPSMLAGIIMKQQPGLPIDQAMAAATNAANQVVVPPSLTVRDLLTNAMVGHYQGDEHPSAQTLAIYQGMAASSDPLTKTLGGALLSLDSDLFPPDSNVALDLNSGSIMDALVTDAITYQLAPGGTHQTVAMLISKDGSTYDVTNQATYTSSNPAVATVNASGVVAALASGNTVVTAVYGSSQESVNITVANTVPAITLNIPGTAARGGAVHATGSISNNGPVAGVSLGITVRDVNGATKYVNQTTSAADGSFSFDFGLPADASLGNWQVFVAGGGTVADQAFTVTGGGASRTVSSVASINPITVPYGTALANVPLPANVTVTLSDNSTVGVNVTWDNSTPAYDGNTAGDYAFTGALALPADVTNPSYCMASVKVTVQRQPSQDLTVTSAVDIPGIKVNYGTSLANVPLPVKATVNLSDGNTANRTVTWDGGTPAYNGNTAGAYTFGGTLSGLPANVTNPNGVKASVRVTVLQQVQPATVTSGTAITVTADQPQSVTVPQGVTPPPITTTVTATANGQKQTTLPLFNASIQQTIQNTTQTVTMQIPDQTTVTGSASWNGQIQLPQVVSSSGLTGLGSATVNLVLQLGDNNLQLDFDKAVRILLPGMAGKSIGYTEGSGSVIPITYHLNADTQQAADKAFFGDPPATSDGVAYINVGQDLVVWTSHFCKLVVYSTPITSSGGGGGITAPAAVISTTGSATVNPAAGGSIGLGSDVSVSIPAGALQGSTAVDVSVRKVINAPGVPSGLQLLGSVYEFTVGGKARYSFVKPVTLTFTFNAATMTPGETPSIYYYDTASSQWVSLGGTVSGNTISVTVDHFTQFGVFVKEVPPPPVPAQVFSDVPASYWASDVITSLAEQGYTSGYPDGTFKPDNQITRAEFTTIIAKSLGLSEASSSGSGFADLDTIPGWAKGYVAAAAKAGLVSGYSDGTFKANDNITRTEIAVIVAKALHASQAEAPAPAFTDATTIPAWAAGYVSYDVAQGILSGYPDNTFQPMNRAKRAEACTMIVKMLHSR